MLVGGLFLALGCDRKRDDWIAGRGNSTVSNGEVQSSRGLDSG